LTAGAFVSLIFVFAGCDEYVQVTRDRDVHIARNATWAWRPAVEEAAAPRENRSNRASENRPVISRDDIRRDQRTQPGTQLARRDPDANDEVVRGRVKTAIEQSLTSKGFKQVSDPAAADFLVDYKFAVNRRNETVPVGYGGYPGLVCGPFRCWESWGYGPAYVGYENIHFREGTIVFDWVQQSTRHLAYRAVGEKPVHRDAFSLTQNDINGLVHHLLKDLKPGK
jgi:hypothetical protein